MIEVLSAGPLLSVQDAGRRGLRHLGISGAGPIDADAMALANALCGNDPGAAALEFAGPAGRFRADRALRFAVVGGSCDIRIDGRPVAAGESHRLAPGEVLQLGAPAGVTWGYLAVSGGIATVPVLGARATHLRSGLGGHEGRALRAGDRLPLGPEVDGPCLRPAAPLPAADPGAPIRLILGPQAERFAPEILARLTAEPFTVTPQRDRMAMVLGGPALPAAGGHDIVSDGTVPGSVQVPGSGRALVLLAESQTTGGYPKIATIAAADLARLAQMPVGAALRFEAITREAGEDLWCAQRTALRALIAGLVPKPEGALRSDYLLSCDLVGGVFDPAAVTGTDLTAGEI